MVLELVISARPVPVLLALKKAVQKEKIVSSDVLISEEKNSCCLSLGLVFPFVFFRAVDAATYCSVLETCGGTG